MGPHLLGAHLGDFPQHDSLAGRSHRRGGAVGLELPGYGHLPVAERLERGGTYCIYAFMSLLSALFVWKMVPETKGKTLEQMSALWHK